MYILLFDIFKGILRRYKYEPKAITRLYIQFSLSAVVEKVDTTNKCK